MKRFLVLGSALLSFAASLGADGPFKFYSIAPCRIIDTRAPNGGGWLAHAEIRGFLIASKCGIPLTAKMAALNFAVLFPTDGGNITAFPSNPTNLVPLVSTVNWTAGETAIANGSVVGLTASTQTQPYNISVQAVVPPTGGGTGHLDLVIDVTGYLQ